jgi:hypothetical protein
MKVCRTFSVQWSFLPDPNRQEVPVNTGAPEWTRTTDLQLRRPIHPVFSDSRFALIPAVCKSRRILRDFGASSGVQPNPVQTRSMPYIIRTFCCFRGSSGELVGREDLQSVYRFQPASASPPNSILIKKAVAQGGALSNSSGKNYPTEWVWQQRESHQRTASYGDF